MTIENINSIRSGYEALKQNQRKQGPAKKAPPKADTDSYIPSSSPGVENTDRSQLLKDIAKRVKSGYYNSDDVIDDLSGSFAKAFQIGLQ